VCTILVRRIRVVAAVLAVVWSLASAAEAAGLRLAMFRCDMTPPLGHNTYPNNQPLAIIEHPLIAKGIVIDDGGGQRYVLCAIDWCALCNSAHDLYRRKIAEAAGTEVARVALHTVHQHTAPVVDLDELRGTSQSNDSVGPRDTRFYEVAADWLAVAVRESLVCLQPFDRIGSGEAKVERVGSTRRLIDADGKVHTPRWSNRNPMGVREREEGIIDPLLKTITFARGDQPLVRLHFYACHPQSFYGDPRVTYDFPGMAREELEKNENVFQVYFTGCGGDVLVGKYNDGTRAARDEFRGRLLRSMEAAIAATRYVPVESIQWRAVDLRLPPLQPAASSVDDAAAKTPPDTTRPEESAYAQRLDRPLILTGLQMGRIHILGLPGECLVDFQLYAQRVAPDDFVAVAAYADLGTGYVCTDKACDEGGYEPSATHVGRGSEALLKDAILNLLGGK
jgi:hypothetical protein